MMAIIDPILRDQIAAIVKLGTEIFLPPILIPPLFPVVPPSSYAARTLPRPTPRPIDDESLILTRFMADQGQLARIFALPRRATPANLDVQSAPDPELLLIGYDAALGPLGPVDPTSARNTSWMIPVATETSAQLRPALGLSAASIDDGDGVYVVVIDRGIDKKKFNVVAGWSREEPRHDQWGKADPHGDTVAYGIRAVAQGVTFIDIAAVRPLDSGPKHLRAPRLFDVAQGLEFLSRRLNPETGTIPRNAPVVVCCAWMATSEPAGLPDSVSFFRSPNHPLSVLVKGLAAHRPDPVNPLPDDRRGIPIVFAAGNCGPDGYDLNCGGDKQMPTVEPGAGTSIRGVNGLDEVLCVGAADLKGRLLSNSPAGPSTLKTPKPDLCGFASFAGKSQTGDHGTSTAAAVITGVIADLQRECPGVDAEQIRAALIATARRANPHDPAYWGAGLVDAGAARARLCGGVTSIASAHTGLVEITDQTMGRSPLSCQRRIRAMCENRDEFYAQARLGPDERDAIESLDGARVAALLQQQLAFALEQAWNDRSSLPEFTRPQDGDATDGDRARCGDERPRLLVNLIADLARSADARRDFFANRSAFVRARYALSPESCQLAESMSPETFAEVSATATEEARTDLEIHPQYPNVQSFPGPWIEAFFPDRGRLGDVVAVTIEGRGFVPGRPLMVALFERRIGTDPESSTLGAESATVSAIVSPPVRDARQQELLARRRLDLDQVCDGVLARQATEPTECPPKQGDLALGETVHKSWPPELGAPALRLGSLQLAEDLDRDSAATRFRVEVVFDLRPGQLCAGEYDLWVGHCDASGCQGRAAVGPTTFTVEPRVDGTEKCPPHGSGRAG
jgi:hypothetical protein